MVVLCVLPALLVLEGGAWEVWHMDEWISETVCGMCMWLKGKKLTLKTGRRYIFFALCFLSVPTGKIANLCKKKSQKVTKLVKISILKVEKQREEKFKQFQTIKKPFFKGRVWDVFLVDFKVLLWLFKLSFCNLISPTSVLVQWGNKTNDFQSLLEAS